MILKPLDYDHLFATCPDPIVVSYTDILSSSKSRAKEYVKAICQEDTGPLTFIASCDCGELDANFWIGKECPKCHTICRSQFASELQYRAWLEIPEDLPPVLHPVAYRCLKTWLGGSRGSTSILSKILDYEAKLPEALSRLPRGFAAFYEGFDSIMEQLIRYKLGSKTKVEEDLKTSLMVAFIEKYRDILFVRHLPMLDESLHLLTKTGAITYCDSATPHILNAKIELQNLIHMMRNSPITETNVNQRLLAAYMEYVEYVTVIYNTKIFKKPGFIRKCLMGARTHFSYRGVISPITGDHMADELWLPWNIGTTVLKLEIINLLLHRYGMTLAEAMRRYACATVTYDPLIDQIMKTLIQECPYPGLPTLFGRNPSIRHGAEQLFFVTRIKNNLHDATINLSPLIITAPNADFDGKALPLITVM